MTYKSNSFLKELERRKDNLAAQASVFLVAKQTISYDPHS